MDSEVNKQQEWVIVTLILLLAAVLRFWTLGQVPPGLSHDEVANALIARDIHAGHHALYFTAAYGHEPLYQYVQAGTIALFGENWLGLRYPSAALGLLGLAVTYVLVRRLFGVLTGLLSGAWLALSFWPLLYARVGLRVIALPFIAALAAFFLLRATGTGRPGVVRKPARTRDWALAGLFLALSLYTYMAARVLPAILVVFLLYRALVRRRGPVDWHGLLVLALVTAVVAAPLLVWLATHPGAEYRVAEVREPLDRLLAGDPSLAAQNLVANLKSFTFSGDPWAHQNIPGRPVFADPLSALLFYAGLLIALWRWRDPRYGFLLIWLAGALVPSVLSAVAPSSVRDIMALVTVFTLPSLAVTEAWDRLRARTRVAAASRWALLLLPLVIVGLTSGRDYFLRWPQNDVTRFFYQSDLVAVAHRLDDLDPDMPLTVAGLSVHSMDSPTLELAARRDVSTVRLCDTRESLLLPADNGATLFVPRIVPFDAALRERLLGWGAVIEEETPAFVAYHLPADEDLRHYLTGLESTPISFGGQLTFLGYEWVERAATPGGNLVLLTYWRVEEPPPAPLKLFLHLTTPSGALVAQHDGLGSPPHGWANGDLVVQRHTVQLPSDLPPGPYQLQVGVYDATSGVRLEVDGADHLALTVVEVTE